MISSINERCNKAPRHKPKLLPLAWWHGQRLYKTIAPPPTIFRESGKKRKNACTALQNCSTT